MQPTIIKATDTNNYAQALAQAAEALRGGALVVFPTETVYGVAGNAADAKAMERLRGLKGRENVQPFTVHIGRPAQARDYLTQRSPLFRRLARKAWPGPLTLLVEEPHPEQTGVAKRCPPDLLREMYAEGRVGLRCPDHPVATRLLSDAGAPVVASSANRRGAPPPLSAAAAIADLGADVDLVIDAGPTRHNTASTIVELRGNQWRVVRAGAIDERQIERLATTEILILCTGNSCRSPMAECLFRAGLSKRLGLSEEELAAAGYRVTSAGTAARMGGLASGGALDEMAKRGLDLTCHRSQPLTPELVHRAERIYVMSDDHKAAVLDLQPLAASRLAYLDPKGPIMDPMGGGKDLYRTCAEQIERAVQIRLEELLDEDRDRE